MKIAQLDSFCMIARLGSINGASEKSGVPTSTLSRHLRELEDHLGVTLIERTTHSSILTPWGETFLPHAQTALDAFSAARDAIIDSKDEPEGDLNILAPSAFGRRMIAPLLPAFQRQHPKVRVSLSLDNRNPDLNDAEAHIAFRVGTEPVGIERFETIGKAPFMVVASPAYVATSPPIETPKDLLQHPVFAVSKDLSAQSLPFRRATAGTEHATAAGDDGLVDPDKDTDIEIVELEPAITAFDPTAIREMVLQGNGVAMIASIFCDAEVRNGALMELLPTFPIASQQHYGLAHMRSLSSAPKVQAFLAYIRPLLSQKLSTR